MRLIDLPETDDTLRPYQITGKREIYRAWESCRTVLFQMPTGTGKTRLFSSIIKDIRRLWQEDKVIRRVLVLAHRTELIQQIDETLSFKYGISHGIIKSGVEETWNRTVQVASVQTIARRLDKWTAKDFAYIIIDEAHHAVSSTYMKICKQFPEAKILGVTATPCRLSGDALRRLFGVLVLSQPVSKFIEQHYLSPYSYYSIKPESRIQLDLDNIHHFNVEGDYAEADMMRVIDTNKVRANIVDAYLKYAKGKKGIVYTINQEHNKHICEAYEKIGVKIKSIDSKTPAEDRKSIVSAFKSGKIDIICNVNIFSEGFDCPDIEFIQLARPTCSLAMYLQQVGRGLRPHPKGIPATILDNVGSYNKFGLPSANRKWRSHFEGQGQRVTQSSNAASVGFGTRTARKISEGDEDMMLIFSGTSLAVEENNDFGILFSIRETKDWFPFGSTVLLDPYGGIFNVRKFTKAGCWYGEYEDQDDWLCSVEDEIETDRMDPHNEDKLEEIDWVETKIRRMFKFTHEGKVGLCQFINDPASLDDDIAQCKSGKKKVEDIVTILLPPVYDEIGVPDDQGRAICVKDGKYGVLSSESYLPIVPFRYQALEFQPNGLYLALKDDKVGLIKGDEIIIPFEYEEIQDLTVSTDEQYYLLSEGDHYHLLLFKGERQINQQRKLAIKQRLFGSIYLGLSLKKDGFLCNSDGEIIYSLYFERIGVTLRNGTPSFILGFKKIAFELSSDLSNLSDLIQCEESNAAFVEQFQIEKLFIVQGNNINEWGKKETSSPKTAQPVLEEKKPEPEQPQNESGIDIGKEGFLEESRKKESPKTPLPTGVFEGEDGKLGYRFNDVTIVHPEYDEITPYGKDRLIVKKDGKCGVLALDGSSAAVLVPCIFKGLTGTTKHRYNVQMFESFSEQHTEDYLTSVILQTEQHLILKASNGKIQIRFQAGQVGEYKEVTYLGGEVFIACNDDDKYGLIRCHHYKAEILRPFEYSKIELSDDKRNVLLTKTGRPRFIPLHSILSK